MQRALLILSASSLALSTANAQIATGGATQASGASSVAGGSTGQLQYNNGAGFGGASGLTVSSGVLSTSGQITSTLATGTAPFVVASATNVANLNATTLTGYPIGTSGATIPLLTGNNTFGGAIRVGVGGSLAAGGAASMIISYTAPTISSGFGASPAIQLGGGSFSFTVTVGSGGAAQTGTLTMPTATHGWICQVNDQSTKSASVAYTMETANTTTSVTVGNYTDVMASGPWTAGDVLQFLCSGY